MTEDLKLHIKKLQKRAVLSVIAILAAGLSIGLGVWLLFEVSIYSIVFFIVSAMCVVYYVYLSRIAKRDAKETDYNPAVFNSTKNNSYEKLATLFDSLADKDNVLSDSENMHFYRLKKILKLRVILYRTEDFNKNEYDSAIKRINKKANKELNISHWVSKNDVDKMMRFNIICTNTLNNALYQFISKNASHNLTRVEGIINIAVVGNRILLPPLYGDCDILQVRRYKKTVKFIIKYFVNI